VREEGGTLLLRIDDCDGTRARPEFVAHIFEIMEWLGIDWQMGPRDPADFYGNYSQVTRKGHYFAKIAALGHLTYACACSRKEKGEASICACRGKGLPFAPGKTALRLRVEDSGLARSFGDVVLWRKDDGPAYHWASVVDDLDQGVNLIVRGEDLRESSELQRYIAVLASPGGFGNVRFVHHPLLTDESGAKLSKSRGALSVVELRKAGASAGEIRARVDEIIKNWG
jgi:glutamyl-tRNA synthetase